MALLFGLGRRATEEDMSAESARLNRRRGSHTREYGHLDADRDHEHGLLATVRAALTSQEIKANSRLAVDTVVCIAYSRMHRLAIMHVLGSESRIELRPQSPEASLPTISSSQGRGILEACQRQNHFDIGSF